MLFNFEIHLTDKDYLTYNEFVTFKSHYGKKRIRTSRLILGVFLGLLILVMFLCRDGDLVMRLSIAGVQLILLVIFELLWPKMIKASMKLSLNGQKKAGKPAYSPEAQMEFFDDYFAEITDKSKSEQQYAALERVSVYRDEYVYLHLNSLAAFILPRTSFATQEEYDRFLGFISGKCPTVDRYYHD